MATHEQGSTQVIDRINVKHPDMYDVILLNDDFTTMDFVVHILVDIFYKNEGEAVKIMYDVHDKGEGIAGTYTYDIALSKKIKAETEARGEGFPLRLRIQKH